MVTPNLVLVIMLGLLRIGLLSQRSLGNASYLIYILLLLVILPIFGHGPTGGATFPSFLCESLLIWIVMALIIRGVKEASIVNIMITTVSLMALASLILVFIYGFKTEIFAKIWLRTTCI